MKIFNKILLIILIINFPQLFAQSELSFNKKIIGENYFNSRKLVLDIQENGITKYIFEKELLPYQSIPQVYLIDSAKLCLTFPSDGSIEFYQNKIMTNKYFFYKSHPQNEQTLHFANNSFESAILFSENQKNKIFIFDLVGNLKDSIIAEDGIISGFTISNKNNFIAYSFYNWETEEINNKSIILDRKNDKILETEEKFWCGKFNSDDNNFLGFTNKNSFCYNISTKKLLWKSDLANDEIYLDGIWYNNNTLLIKAEAPELKDGNWIYNKANILSINSNGDENIIQIVNSSFSKINFEKAQNKILLKADERLVELEKLIID